MDTPGHIYYFQMLLLLLLMGVCTVWIGRLLQWVLLRKNLPGKKVFVILTVSLVISYLFALIAWFCWPHSETPMWGIFFLPAVLAEIMILTGTIFIFKKRKRT